MTRTGSTGKKWLGVMLILPALVLIIGNAKGQTAAFTYQGKLADNGNPANGQYDFEFKLFDTATVGTGIQQGSTLIVPNVQATDGIFTAQLDFGVSVFPGADRFLEIAVKPTSGSTFITLGPRQAVTANPYAIRSLNSATADGLSVACVGCITSSQIQSVQGSQVTGSIAGSQIIGEIPMGSVPAGNANYIQNGTGQQAATNFNIGGTGTASILDATMQYSIGGSRILSNAGTDNLFAGVDSGLSNTTGQRNAFFGKDAGKNNTMGNENAFFGTDAGSSNSTGRDNSFFGWSAGLNNTSGENNSFFGTFAGQSNTTGDSNSFFGLQAGRFNQTGFDNSFFGFVAGQSTTGVTNAFFGALAGYNNTTGSANSFFGKGAGEGNTTGTNNTFIGVGTRFNTTNATGNGNTLLGSSARVNSGISNATAIGSNATVTLSNSLVLGGITGINLGTDTNVGIGTTAPKQRLHVAGQGVFTAATVTFSPGDGVGAAIRIGFDSSNDYGYINANVTGVAPKNLILQGNTDQGNVGIGTENPNARLTVNGGASKPGGGSWAVFSDERLKNIKGSFTPGLKAVMRLKPIRYEYKPDNALGIKSSGEQIGFAAQAVEKVIPEAVTKDDKGYLLINNDPILWTMLNAIKEQQQQIEALRKLVCADHRNGDACK